jgi:carbon monoxide dehydrogenase subunit G
VEDSTMRFEGAVHVNTAQQQVWQFLMNPQKLSLCTPGVESWRTCSDKKQVEIILLHQLGSNRQIRIPIQITWQTIEPIHAATLRFETNFGNQTITALGDMALQPDSTDKTTLDFTLIFDAENNILLQLINNSAPKVIEQFFKCLKSTLEKS